MSLRAKLQGRVAIASWICILWVSLFGAGLINAQAEKLVGIVDYPKSGHTFELLSELSAQIPILDIRLAGIQAPDMQQKPWGPEARQCLSELAKGSVHIEPQALTPDRYDRLWAYVWKDKQLINAAVLAQGCAFLDSDRLSQQRYGETLIYAQEEARLLGKGIWAPDTPLRETPTSFRQTLASP
ncbi:MAG: thermonuclease family protein [Leptolyngbya sp. SIO1D8]|nr:thermonuclease family protein [Leptolyngbya sp. SIO1D8]